MPWPMRTGPGADDERRRPLPRAAPRAASRPRRRWRRSRASRRRTRRRRCRPSRSPAAGRWPPAARRTAPLGEAGQRGDVAVAERGALGGDQQPVGDGRSALLAHLARAPGRPGAPSRPGTRARCRSTCCSSAAGTPRRSSASRRQSRESDGARKRCRTRPRSRRRRGRRRRGRRRPRDLAEQLLARCARLRSPTERPASSRAWAPGRVLGQEAGARLLQAAQRLVERRAEGAVDGHHLAGRLHLRAQRAVGARELVEREARQLDHHVVERGLEGGDRGPRDGVGDLGQPPADGDLRRHAGDGVAGRLGGQRGRAADARVDLDDRVVAWSRARARTGRCSRPPRRAPG